MKTILAILCTVIGLSAFAQSNSTEPTNFVKGEILLNLQDETSIEGFISNFNKKESRFQIELKNISVERRKIILVRLFPEGTGEDFAIQVLKKEQKIENAFLNKILKSRTTEPNDPSYPIQWSLPIIQMAEAWDFTTGGETVHGDEIVIAVIEAQGADVFHSDLRNNMWVNSGEIPDDGIDNDGNGYVDDIHGFNMKGNGRGTFTSSNHGTSVLGIIGAEANNGQLHAGVNWKVKMMLLEGKTFSQIYESYEYIYTQRKLYRESNGAKGAFIVATNSSLGVDTVHCMSYPEWERSYRDLGSEGVLSVAAAPNDNFDVDLQGDLPASCGSEHLITVSMTDTLDQHFRSGIGKKTIDLSAPGRTIPVLLSNNRVGTNTGTSLSAPHVSGAIALMYSYPCEKLVSSLKSHPEETSLLLKNLVLCGADKLRNLEGKSITGGRLNVRRSMELLEKWCSISEGEFEVENVFPNPVDDKLMVQYSAPNSEAVSFKIHNSIGQVVSEGALESGIFSGGIQSIDVSGLATGSYFLVFENGGERMVKQFLKI